MAQSVIKDGLSKAQQALQSDGDPKQRQIDSQPLTKQVSDKQRITADFGAKQSNTDDWLKVATEDQTGPSLLEDGFAREKVSLLACSSVEHV